MQNMCMGDAHFRHKRVVLDRCPGTFLRAPAAEVACLAAYAVLGLGARLRFLEPVEGALGGQQRRARLAVVLGAFLGGETSGMPWGR